MSGSLHHRFDKASLQHRVSGFSNGRNNDNDIRLLFDILMDSSPVDAAPATEIMECLAVPFHYLGIFDGLARCALLVGASMHH
ncbi:hypothetical protein [Sodalis-like endosymbiont of Proechinophthirus fluctus]|uniref:hypothetical protein n=1 Tax=Sodalis-like endosymbiont of Proechinophthirus fluctus TaxID=1462730 RepID=UPI000B16FC09|nr:hypothetical protein [Sodalis-like endosymbiont of Proechinophthirus fluctus]